MIGLIDIDSNIPNLALMKISAYYKSLGEKVEFVKLGQQYEKIYGSAIFTRSRAEVEKILQVYPNAEIGGTGWDVTKTLPCEVEQMKPDFDLYTYDYWIEKFNHTRTKKKDVIRKAKYLTDVGIGFTKRGCPNKCKFCFVPIKEPLQYEDMSLDQIINPRSNKVILLDNNFSEDEKMIEKSKEIIKRGLEVDLCQGVNVRIMTDEKAYWLSKIKHTKHLRIAWDFPNDEKRVMRGLDFLEKYISLSRVTCYVLVGYNTTLEEDLYRIYRLQEKKVDPYVMVYNERQDGYYRHLERWCNTFIRRTVRFEDYRYFQEWQKGETQITLLG